MVRGDLDLGRRFTIAAWRARFLFCKVTPGTERATVETLRRECSAPNRFYESFAAFDIVKVSTHESLIPPTSHLGNPNVTHTVELFGIPWVFDGVCSGDSLMASKHPLALLTIMRLNPNVKDAFGFNAELAMIEYLGAELKQHHPSVFTTLGASELVTVLAGDDIQPMMDDLTRVRMNASAEAVFHAQRNSIDGATRELPMLARTFSVPLVSFEEVIATESFERLAAKVRPLIYVSCLPGNEGEILEIGRRHLGTGYQVMGRHDFAFQPEQPIPLGDFVEHNLTFRKEGGSRGLYSTTTFLLGGLGQVSPSRVDPVQEPRDHSAIRDFVKRTLDELRVIDESSGIDESYRWAIANYALRLHGCIIDPLLMPVAKDLVFTLVFLKGALLRLSETAKRGDPNAVAREWAPISRILGFAETALRQRSTTVETQLDVTSQPPLLTTYPMFKTVEAMSSMPKFVFDRCATLRKRVDKEVVWDGFVAFDRGSRFRHYPDQVICCPEEAAWRFLEEYHFIAHEIAHGVYYLWDIPRNPAILGLRDVLDTRLKEQIKAENRGPALSSADPDLRYDELWAEVFTYLCFYRDWDLYSRTLWGKWLRTPVVFQNPKRYLLRHLLTAVAGNVDALDKIDLDGNEEALYRHLHGRLDEILSGLSSVKEFASFARLLNWEEDIPNVLTTAERLVFLPAAYRLILDRSGVVSVLNEDAPSLDETFDRIINGQVMVGRIANPSHLTSRLVNHFSLTTGQKPSFRQSVAFIYSLANDYLSRTSEIGEYCRALAQS